MSSSGAIFRASRANKQGLSKALDGTLRNSHDMRVFGVGMLAEFASKDSYRHFLLQRYHFYTAMERRFDAVSSNESNGTGVASLCQSLRWT